MNSTGKHIDELIARYLSGEANPEDAIWLDEWRTESEQNDSHFRKLERLYYRSTSHTYDADSAWNIVKQEISQTAKKGRVVSLWSSPARIAASILLLAGLSTVIYFLAAPGISTSRLASVENVRIDTLPHGDILTLNKNSAVEITLNKRSKSTHIALKGEAFFDLQSGPEYATTVQAGDLIIEDIGTQFNVSAIEENDTVFVQVFEGLVKLYTTPEAAVEVHPGERGVYVKAENKLTKSTFNSENAIAWKTHNFRFTDATLKEVARTINAVFETKIVVEQPIEHCRITVQFYDEEPAEMAEIIAETLGLEIEVSDHQITLKGSGCVQ